jgi:P4 family phage/plasmid primase-like protien
LPIPYDANAVCPHWEQLLNDAFADMVDGDRKITVDLVQELIGAALIDDKPKSLSRALVLFGFPDTGKTVVLKVITALFGGAITTTFAMLEGNHGLQSFARRLPWVLGEAFNQSGWYVSDLVKCIITGDPVEINPKNAPAISMKVNTPAFWGTNHPPKFKESSGSMATRMIIIPMTRTFCKETPVGVAEEARKHNPAWEPHDLVINTELPGVLNWALIGLQRALQRGHFVNTESGKDLLEKSRKDSNCAAAFVDECLDADAEAMMSTTDVYSTFKRWWIGEHGEKSTVPSPTTFGHDLANLPNSRIAQDKNKFKNKSSQRFYLGCKLNEAGIGYWQDAANIACISGTKDHRLAETVEKTMRDISPTWKATEEYRRIVPNIQRFVEEQKKRERKEREQQQQATSSDGADKEFPWA